jgi:hypothetical protein
MNISLLTSLIEQHLAGRAADFGMRGGAIRANYVLNWGGFVNHSFTITGGDTRYHLKLSSDAGDQRALSRWWGLQDLLVPRCHAPRIVDWVAIPDTPYAGPLFEHVEGRNPDFAAEPALLRAVLDVVDALHRDTALAERVAAAMADPATAGDGGPPVTCLDTFVSTFIERFDADLEIIRADRPPFVSAAAVEWMAAETRRLEVLARAADAFAAPAAGVIHGDLWANNILVRPDGAWVLLDWDDLAFGDPALDLAILLWPLAKGEGEGANWRRWLAGGPHDLGAAFAARMDLYMRAQLLDEVIDLLADWIEARVAPAGLVEGVRREKERGHGEAWESYRVRYGGA